MSGITTTKSVPKRNLSTSKQLIAVSEPISVSPKIDFPTPTTPIRHLFRTPVTVSAGPEKHPFPVHLEILLTASPFFAAAYNPSYTFSDSPKSPTSNTSSPDSSPNYNNLSLPSVSHLDFEYFIQWLYTRTLDHEDLTGPHPAYFKLIRLYGLADQLQVTALKNRIVDELSSVADKTNSCLTPDDTRVVWDDESGCAIPSSCLFPSAVKGRNDGGGQAAGGCGGWVGEGGGGGLRELISDLFVWKKTDKLIAEHADQWDERFLREVIVKLKREKARGDKAPWRDRVRACKRYHVHDEWAPVCPGVSKGD